MKLHYSDHIDLTPSRGSRFPADKYRRLRERLQAENNQDFNFIRAKEVSVETLNLAHDVAYIDAVLSGSLSSQQQRRIGFPWSPAFVSRARCSVGATIAACKAALQDGASANLAGGTHHASRKNGAGYCVFNDIAVAARLLIDSKRVTSILVVDADVHQGDGTASILGKDKNIYTFSIHCMDNFPKVKQPSHLDIPLLAGVGDDEFLRQFKDGLKRALLAARPELVIYLAGADPYIEDRLGRLSLSKDGLKQRDELVFSECRRGFIPVALAMGGGYAKDVEDIVDIHAATVRLASSLCQSKL